MKVDHDGFTDFVWLLRRFKHRIVVRSVQKVQTAPLHNQVSMPATNWLEQILLTACQYHLPTKNKLLPIAFCLRGFEPDVARLFGLSSDLRR